MKKLLLLFIFLTIFFGNINTVEASDRYAQCDVCGYCQGKEPPSNWASCASCMYSNIPALSGTGNITNNAALNNYTLKIETDIKKKNYNRAPEPAPGKMYTQLGCFGANLSSFTNPDAAGALVSYILQNLIFPVVGTLGFVTIIYGGFILATAQGDTYKIQQGKRVITGSIVGVIFTFSIVLIINTIGADILNLPTTSGLSGSITKNVTGSGYNFSADFSSSSGPKYIIAIAKCSTPDCRNLTDAAWGSNGSACSADGLVPSGVSGVVDGRWCKLELSASGGSKTITWSSGTVASGKYIVVTNNEIDSSKKCSGNPVCSFNGGTADCSGWSSCSENDYVLVP